MELRKRGKGLCGRRVNADGRGFRRKPALGQSKAIVFATDALIALLVMAIILAAIAQLTRSNSEDVSLLLMKRHAEGVLSMLDNDYTLNMTLNESSPQEKEEFLETQINSVFDNDRYAYRGEVYLTEEYEREYDIFGGFIRLSRVWTEQTVLNINNTGAPPAQGKTVAVARRLFSNSVPVGIYSYDGWLFDTDVSSIAKYGFVEMEVWEK